MIDKSNLIYTKVKNALGANINGSSQTFTASPNQFPFMFFNQLDNPEVASDLDGNENAVSSTIEITVYTNDSTRLTTGRKVASLVNTQMKSLGFRRMSGPLQVVNVSDTNICRLISRYTRVIGSNDTL